LLEEALRVALFRKIRAWDDRALRVFGAARFELRV